MNNNDSFQVGDWLVEPALNQVRSGDKTHALQPKAMAVLVFLAQHQGEVVSREMLFEAVWQRNYVSDAALYRIMNQIRKAFEDNPSSAGIIQTIPKKGYRLVAEINHPSTDSDTRKAGKGRWKHTYLGIAGLVLVIALITMQSNNNHPDNLDYPSEIRRTLTTLAGNESWPDISPDSRWLVFTHQPANASQWDVYLRPINGDDLFQLTDTPANETSPIWSPDGDRLLFHRYQRADDENPADCGIYLVEFIGGEPGDQFVEKRVLECHPSTNTSSLAWRSDGQAFYFSDGQSSTSPYRIFEYGMEDGIRRPITDPPMDGRGDYSLDLSPDGTLISFLRNRRWTETELWVIDQQTLDARKITDFQHILFDVGWGKSNDHILLASISGQIEIWSISEQRSHPILHSMDAAHYPALSPDFRQLAFVSGDNLISDIWGKALHENTIGPSQPLIQSTRKDRYPAFANHSNKLAFVSVRTGLPQIWMRDDDQQLHQLTALDRFSDLQRLRWSPDDRAILASHQGRVFMVDVDTHEFKYLTPENISATAASWSPDGGSIYFSSDQDGIWQVWRMSIDDQQLTRITSNGGFCGEPDPAENAIYFTRYDEPGLWMLPLSGNGQASRLIDDFSELDWNSFEVRRNGLYFASPDDKSVVKMDFETHSIQRTFPREPNAHNGFSISFDESVLAYGRNTKNDTSIVVVE